MKKFKIVRSTVLILLAVLFNAAMFAQLPETFTNTATIDDGGFAWGVAVGADGTVFLANFGDGLRAYTYDGSSFTNTAHIDNGGNAFGVDVGADGTVFLANDSDGLRAYTYDGSSFTNTAHIDNGGNAYGVAVGADGTVFLGTLGGGLRAYTYDGSSFTNTAHIDNGGDAFGVSEGSSGTVFLANGSDGLRAYNYDGSSFSNTAHIDNGGTGYGPAVGSDGTVFLANLTDGLRAYSYDGSSFSNTGHVTEVGGLPYEVALGADGTLFIANANDGLRAYTFDGSSFTNTAHIDDGAQGYGVAVGPDGTVFLANTSNGLRAYTYSGAAVSCDDFTVYLKDSNGDPLSGGSLEYREGGGTPWLNAAEVADGIFCIQTARSQVALLMHNGPQELKVTEIPTNADYTFQTELVTLELLDGASSPVENAEGAYTSNGWHIIGTTNSSGIVQIEMLPNPYNFRMKYNRKIDKKKEVVSSTNNWFTFYVDDLKSSELNKEFETKLTTYPNPFSGNTTIAFSVEEAQEINISVYDQTGRLIQILLDGVQTEGNHKILWDASDVNKGVYFVRLSSNGQVVNKNIVKM